MCATSVDENLGHSHLPFMSPSAWRSGILKTASYPSTSGGQNPPDHSLVVAVGPMDFRQQMRQHFRAPRLRWCPVSPVAAHSCQIISLFTRETAGQRVRIPEQKTSTVLTIFLASGKLQVVSQPDQGLSSATFVGGNLAPCPFLVTSPNAWKSGKWKMTGSLGSTASHSHRSLRPLQLSSLARRARVKPSMCPAQTIARPLPPIALMAFWNTRGVVKLNLLYQKFRI